MEKITLVKRSQIIYEQLSLLYPEAHCELAYDNDIHLLMAIMLSAQTTDASVNKVTPALFSHYPTIHALANANISDVERNIQSLGLYRNKAKNLVAMAQIIIADYQGLVPSTQNELESLPGVGRKTANVYLSEWHKLPRIAVDTHVKRVSVRLGLAEETDAPEKVEVKLMRLFEENLWIEMHHKLIFFGRYFCKAVKPECHHCPLLSICKKPII